MRLNRCVRTVMNGNAAGKVRGTGGPPVSSGGKHGRAAHATKIPALIDARHSHIRTTLAAIFCGGVVAGALVAAPTTQPHDSANLPPTVTSPEPSAKPTIVAVPYRPYMPPARVTKEPRMLAADGQHSLKARRALDLPPVAQYAVDVPAEPQLAAGPAIQIVIPTSATIPVATLAASADTGRATLATDPTGTMAPASALAFTAPPRATSPAPLLVSIPDPTRQPGALPAPAPTAEDSPVRSLDRPPVPSLPVHP